MTRTEQQCVHSPIELLLTKHLNTRIRIANVDAVKTKLANIIRDGVDKLQIISDFDYTCSRYYDTDGETKCWTTHGIFDFEVRQLSPHMSEQLLALRTKYVAIEYDPYMSIEEKVPHMQTWWQTAHKIISEYGFSRDILQRFVRDALVKLRDDADTFIRLSLHNRIPITLFSAGIGDLIQIFFEQKLGEFPANMHLISNMMTYDEQNKVNGFREPLIHTFNKNSSVINNEHAFFETLSSRSNVILLGDSLGDLHMDNGVTNEGEILKIGFLNFNEDILLPQYLAGYDIVLMNDQTFDIPLAILQSIMNFEQM